MISSHLGDRAQGLAGWVAELSFYAPAKLAWESSQLEQRTRNRQKIQNGKQDEEET